MGRHCDLQIYINGQQTFFLNEKTISAFSGRLKKLIKQEKRRSQIKNSGIEVDDFPGGPDGFEMVSRFCYNRGHFPVTISNVSLLHSCAVFLGMTENVSTGNLLHQTEMFLQGIFDWTWNDIVTSLKSCESFLTYADETGLVTKLICALLAKIAQNSDINLIPSSSSSSSSPETTSGFRFSSSARTTPELMKQGTLAAKCWWFDDLSVLPPLIIEKIVKGLGAFGTENNSIVLTRFLLYYLNVACQNHISRVEPPSPWKADYVGIADTAVYGVMGAGKSAFSCRGLFRVLRIISPYGSSKECRLGLEKLIGVMLDQATLDDLLVSSSVLYRDRGVYDVNLVVRLIRLFVNMNGSSAQKLKQVGRLVDKYLREIAPDHNLKASRFLGVAESLPDTARDSFDGVYRSIDIFLESHPSLSFEERSRLCRCLNYEKLSLEACKDLAKNPKIPPRIAVQALMCQQQYHLAKDTSCTTVKEGHFMAQTPDPSTMSEYGQIVLYGHGKNMDAESMIEEENEDMRINLQKMQWRVVELEKVCKHMKGQMSKMVRRPVSSSSASSTPAGRPLPRLC
ncbi:hypothetical protein SAY87_022795 [Trapa incisa]|uniref:Phototropic-responsive NPH3 family protein n=1 Tax=Trapa incisa TaxID=236973 RepID=A0AAN7Q610_9MYRT|nr:hypothetical protein SAY87_022795 [Trapa incisa]